MQKKETFSRNIYASGVQIPADSPLYPYTLTQRAIIPTEGSYHLISSPIPVVYEERSFSSFVISTNGLVAFTTDTSKAEFNNVDWSKDDVSPFLDVPFIAPYYHDGERIGVHREYKGSVEYEQLGPTNPYNRTLRDLGKYCSSQVVGASYFAPTWGLVITWRNVTSRNVLTCTASSCASNTFQLVLITDGTDSFAIFNYEKMDMFPCEYCQAGFNGGNKIGWTDIISRKTNLQNLKNRQSSDIVGRYVFKISPGRVVRAGCSTDSYSDQLSIYPTFAGMFGGKMIDVSGPCFEKNQPYRCRFGQGTDESNATYISPIRVRCMVPRLMVRDNITVSLIGNGKTYYTVIFIVFPGRLSRGEHVTTVSSKDNITWYDRDPSQLTLTWKPELLSNNSNDRVEINLIGYKEDNEMGSYKLLTSLGSNIPASAGTYTLDPRQHQCSGSDCQYEIGLLEVRLMDNAFPMKYMYLSSEVIPIAWYVRTSMLTQYGTTWPTDMCVKWYNQDKQDMSWLDYLLNCPCSLTQAVSDFGRWQPDGSCNLQNAKNPNNCFYHTTAVHCVRAVQPVHGAGNQCCYSSTGLLIYAEDTFQGSTPDKGHDWGAAPYGKKFYVPSLSHWLEDVVTFYYCCLWTGYNSCDYYMDQRPTKNCAGYNPPIPASVYGQGHVMTFSGVSPRRMYGPGDYVLFRSGNTEIQGRFNRNPYPTEKTDSHTVLDIVTLVGIAVQDKGTSDRVEIQLRGPDYDRSTQHLNVRVNGQNIAFNEKSLFWQDYRGVAIVNTDDRNEQSNFTVLLSNGIGFQIAETANTLQMDLMVPRAFNNVLGLFGTLSGHMLLPNGTAINMMYLRASDEYNKFQLAWAVQENGSLFRTLLPANHSLLGPVNVEPAHLNTDTPIFCKQNQECIYDYRHTGSEAIARSSIQAAERYAALHNNLQPVRSCGILDVPRSRKTNYDYTLGTTTTITSCRVGQLQGTATYTCVETSNETQAWSPAVDAVCHATTSATTPILTSTAYNWMFTTQQTTTTMSTATSTINITGCVDLHFPEHWETIGPNIQHIKILPSPNHALVYCQPGYNAFLASQHTYSDHFQITCRDGSWKSHSVCQKIDAVIVG
ncbi:sushi domain-containing protein 2-like isoform X2 [Dreissena polymorpha]|uniref:sushi domain-containing protein 2-like isoform X2 n=1 Tax=Dreissena polymorpha TaxID=45954 RepID=UPI00226568EC|nr:sushi domain-containing protein 2-like isoform X2 [Dreissena polymorpha]